MPNHVLTTRVVPTYTQLEQEVQALRDEVEFYKQELENILRQLKIRERPNAEVRE